jgi:hypothetical protein
MPGHLGSSQRLATTGLTGTPSTLVEVHLKKLSWFRLYSEAVDDAKLCLLAFEDRWHFVALLCCKAQGVLDTTRPDLLPRVAARKLGLSAAAFDEAMKRLAELDLIDRETLQPSKWSDRQFESDSAAERQKAYRERLKERALRNGDVTVTPQETETETDTDTEKTKETTDVVSLPSTDGTAAADGVGKGKYVVPDCPYQALVALYHEALPQCPKVEVLSVQRKSHLRARWRQVCVDEKLDAKKGLAWFKDFFEYVGESKFLTGRVTRKDNGRPFVASLDWLIGAEKFVKTFEGKYHE